MLRKLALVGVVFFLIGVVGLSVMEMEGKGGIRTASQNFHVGWGSNSK